MSVVTFLRNAIADYKNTASLVPSSRHLAQVMVRPLCGKAPRVVVEFGPGTGVITRELLRLMPDDGTLFAFEISPRFVTYLRETIPDLRLQVVQAGAETAAAELSYRGIEQVDGVVSSLGISFMDTGSVARDLPPAPAAFGHKRNDHPIPICHSRMGLHGGRIQYFDAGSDETLLPLCPIDLRVAEPSTRFRDHRPRLPGRKGNLSAILDALSRSGRAESPAQGRSRA